MDKEPPIDAFILWNFTNSCQFNCQYCFFSYEQETACLPFFKKLKACWTWKDKRRKKPVRLQANKLLAILKDKKYLIQLSGGEPFLTPSFLQECQKLTEKHYIRIISNFVAPSVENFLKTMSPERVYNFVVSLHIVELKRLDLEDRFISNLILARSLGYRFIVLVVAHPALLKEIEVWRVRLAEFDIDLHCQMFRGVYKCKEYPEEYTDSELSLFESFDAKEDYRRKGMLCNAGYNVHVINFEGKISSCFMGDNCGSLDEGFVQRESLQECPVELCPCLFPVYEKALFLKACQELNIDINDKKIF